MRNRTSLRVPAESQPPDGNQPLRLLPSFKGPSPVPETETEAEELEKTEGPTLGSGSPSGIASGVSSEQVIPTEGSTRPTDPAQARNTSKLIGNLVRIAVLTAEKLLSRAGRDFRRPTDAQIMGFSRPVARIAVRHLDTAWLSDDLNDVIEAGGEASGWMLEGPIAPRRDWETPETLVGMEHSAPTFLDPVAQQPFPTDAIGGAPLPTSYLD